MERSSFRGFSFCFRVLAMLFRDRGLGRSVDVESEAGFLGVGIGVIERFILVLYVERRDFS